ncbi:MAG TPA: ATP-binding protein [Longimicrobium sp.]|nr:ATP-binding protein [Longimicrobium sp.]
MATRLPLRSLEIEGYRAIRQLKIARLGQVNLFVGKNNVGKTSLLEAMRIYLSRNPRSVLAELIRERTDYRPPPYRISRPSERELDPDAVEAVAQGAESFFHGAFTGLWKGRVRIGPDGLSHDTLSLSLPWAEALQSRESLRIGTDLFVGPESPLVEIEIEGEKSALPFDALLRRVPLARASRRSGVIYIPASGFDPPRLAALWNEAASERRAGDVEHALRSIVPDLERVQLLGDSGAPGRSVTLELREGTRPIPLRSMGDGVNRVFGIALAMVQAEDGAVLIDEAENGLHYSVQEEVWRAVLSLAHHLNVQVFATTHSWDCIQAFAAAANDSAEVNGMLHRIENRGRDTLRVVEMTEKDLALVARQRIEVR